MEFGELEDILRKQIQFLRNSCQVFDEGHDGEALRLAVSARVLLHDTKDSHPLLGQLGLLDPDTPFHSVAEPWISWDQWRHEGLVSFRSVLIEKGSEVYSETVYLPRLLDTRPLDELLWVPFTAWWAEIVLDDRQGHMITRKDLTLALANKEGGAHVDPNLTQAYEAVTRGEPFWTMRWSSGSQSGSEVPAGRKEFVSMRTIAHELLITLQRMGYA